MPITAQRASWLALTICLLAACGGGGGDDGGGPAPPPNNPPPSNIGTLPGGYTGRTTAATLDRTTTPKIVASVVGELGLINSAGRPTIQQASVDGESPVRRSVRVREIMERRAVRVRSASLRVMPEEACGGGGSVDTQSNISASGTGTLTLTYRACVEEGVTLDGVVRVVVNRFDFVLQEPTDFSATFENLSTRIGQFRAIVNGTTAVVVTGAETRTTTNATGKYEPDNVYVRLEIVDIATRVGNGSLRQVSGRLYVSEYGYVDVSTVATVFLADGEDNATSGRLRVAGAAGAIADVTFEDEQAVVSLDGDGNGQIEASLGFASVSALHSGNQSPVARAGADATVEWNQPIRLDASASTDWENDALTYRWTVISAPTNLSSLAHDAAVFDFAPGAFPGEYILQVAVGDGRNTSVDRVRVTMGTRGPPAPGGPGAPSVQSMLGRVLEFGAGRVQDIESDPARRRVYVALRNEIVVLSADTYLIETRLPVGSLPVALAMSADGTRLYVALGNGGSVVIVNLDTHAKTTVEVATELGTSSLTDVIEAHPGVVLVGGFRAQPGNSFLATVDTNDNNRVRRVGGGDTYRGTLRFGKSSDGRHIYVGIDESSEYFVRLDNDTPILPIVETGSVTSGVNHFEVNQRGDMLITGSGVVLDALTFQMIRNGFGAGVIAAERDRSALLQVQHTLNVSLLHGTTLVETARFISDCPMQVVAGAAPVGLRGEWLINLSSGTLCVVSTSSPQTRPGVDGNRLLPSPPSTPVAVPSLTMLLEDSTHADMELDLPRNRIYVSALNAHEVVIVDATFGGIVGRIPMPGRPTAVLLSDDGERLYVGQREQGSVAVVDTRTLQVERVLDVSVQLGRQSVGALFEVSPTRLFVGAHPENGTEISFPVEVDPADASTALRIGDPRGYCMTSFGVSPSRQYLYIGGVGCDSAFEKRDLSTPDLQLVIPSDPGDALSFHGMTQSTDGSRLYLPGADIVNAATLRRVGHIQHGGVPFLSVDGTKLLIVSGNQMSTFDLVTQERTGLISGTCGAVNSGRYEMWPDHSRFAVLTPNSICVIETAP